VTWLLTILSKVRLNAESIKGSNLVAVRHTTIQVSEMWISPWAVYEQ